MNFAFIDVLYSRHNLVSELAGLLVGSCVDDRTLRIAGEYTDSYIKLIYLRSRMYDPLTGRFLTKDSWQGDYNRPLSLNRWMYVEGNPINLTDPTGFCGNPGESPCPDWWEKRLHIYSEGLGYFDSRHLGRGWDYAAWFVERIEEALGRRHVGMLPLPRAYSGRSYWVDYAVSSKITSKEEIYGIAYGMYIDFERGYEEHQNSMLLAKLSGFSPEDLPSDHLGFWAYMNGYQRDEIPTLLQCLGKVEVLDFQFLKGVVINTAVNYRGEGSIIGIPENYEFLPMIRETIDSGTAIINTTKNIAWPSWLEIQPIPSGPNTWQVIKRSRR